MRSAWMGEGARPHTKSLIQRWLAFWACLPATVDPQPLIGIAADEVFDDFGEFCGVGYDVGLVITGANQLDGGIEAQDVFAQCRIPDGKAGDDGGVGAQGDAGKAAGSAGRDAEEIYEHTLWRGHVGVHEDADGFAGAHGGEQTANEIIFVHGAIAVHGAVALDEGVDVGIVVRTHDYRQRMALQRVSEGREFPGSEVSGEIEDAFAASVGALEVFKSVIDDDAGDIFTGVAREEADFGELAS